MKGKRARHLLALAVCCVLTVGPGLAGSGAQQVQTYDLMFSTSGQGMWGGGSSESLDLLFLDNESLSGSASLHLTTRLGLPYASDIVSAVLGYFGVSFSGYVDLGARASLTSYGDVSLIGRLSELGPGSVDVAYPVQVTLSSPDLLGFRPGETISLGACVTPKDGVRMDLTPPVSKFTVQASVELELGLFGSVYLPRSYALDESVSGEVKNIGIITVDGTAPRFEQPITYLNPQGWFEVPQLGTIATGRESLGMPSGAREVLPKAIGGTAPEQSAATATSSHAIRLEMSQDFGQLEIDLSDYLPSKLVHGFDTGDIYGFQLACSTLSLSTTLTASAKQTLVFDPRFKIRYDFSEAVLVDGQSVTSVTINAGTTAEVSLAGSRPVVVTPTVVISDNRLTNTYTVDGTRTLDGAAGEATISIPGVPLLNDRYCIPVYPDPTWDDPLRWHHECVGPYTTPGWSKDIGPAWGETLASAPISPDTATSSFPLGGLENQQLPAFLLVPDCPTKVLTSVKGSRERLDPDHPIWFLKPGDQITLFVEPTLPLRSALVEIGTGSLDTVIDYQCNNCGWAPEDYVSWDSGNAPAITVPESWADGDVRIETNVQDVLDRSSEYLDTADGTAIVLDRTPPSLPSGTSPSGLETVHTPRPVLSWNPSVDDISGVLGYELEVRYQYEDGSMSPASFLWHDMREQVETSLELERMPSDSYVVRWRIRARNYVGDWCEWSVENIFLVEVSAPSAPHGLAPADGSIIGDMSTLGLVWDTPHGFSDEAISCYEIWVDSPGTEGFPITEIVQEETATLPALSQGADHEFVWRVRAQSAEGEWGDWSSDQHFRVDYVGPSWIAHVSESIQNPEYTIIELTADEAITLPQISLVNARFVTQETLSPSMYRFTVCPVSAGTVEIGAPIVTDLFGRPGAGDWQPTSFEVQAFFMDRDGDGLGTGGPKLLRTAEDIEHFTALQSGDHDDSDPACGLLRSFFRDADNDGFAAGTYACWYGYCGLGFDHRLACKPDTEYNKERHQLAGLEVDECDSNPNSLTAAAYYVDNDNDGIGTGRVQFTCDPLGANTATRSGDCDDHNPSVAGPVTIHPLEKGNSTGSMPIRFVLSQSASADNLSADELIIGGDAFQYPAQAQVALSGGPVLYEVSVSGMGQPGVVSLDVTTHCLSRTSRNFIQFVDVVPPVNPILSSATHEVGVSSSVRRVQVSVSEASDELSSISGFEIAFTDSPSWSPVGTPTHAASWGGGAFTATEDGDWWLHLATADSAGNWSDPTTLGPFVIDTLGPSIQIRTQGTSPTHEQRIAFEILASEPIIPLGTSALQLRNASVEHIAQHSATSFTVWVQATEQGQVELTIPNGTVADTTGNSNVNPATASIAYDVMPTVTWATIYSSNAATEYAQVGDTIVVRFETNEPVVHPMVKLNRDHAAVVGGGTTWMASREVTDRDGLGSVDIEIEIKDRQGNVTEHLGSTDLTQVYCVHEPPYCPVSLAPTSGTLTNDPTPRLSWERQRVEGAAKPREYELQILCSWPDGTEITWTSDPTRDTHYVLPDQGTTEYAVSWKVRSCDKIGRWSEFSPEYILFVDTLPPSSTLEQEAAQIDPTNTLPLLYTLTFSEAITGLEPADLVLEGEASGGTATVLEIEPLDGTTYQVSVNGALSDGLLRISLPEGKVEDMAGNPGRASIGTDHEIVYDTTAPTNPVLSSATHAVGVSSAATAVQISGAGAIDALSGISGFETQWIQNPTAAPTHIVTELPTWTAGIYAASSDGDWYFHVCAQDLAGNWSSMSTFGPVHIDTTRPTVTINQRAGQSDPTNTIPVEYVAVFSEVVTGLAGDDIEICGTSTPTTALVTELDPFDGTKYLIQVGGTSSDGSVLSSIVEAAAQDAAGNVSHASTSVDNRVTLDQTRPAVSVEQGETQSDPTDEAPILFRAVFTEPVAGLDPGDVVLSGSAAPTVAALTEIAPMDGTTYQIEVSGMGDQGAVRAAIASSGAMDAAGNGNEPSTSLDGEVTYNVAPELLSITPSTSLIADATSTFTLTLLFNESMLADGSANPAVSFTPTVGSTLSYSSVSWSTSIHADDTCTLTYSVIDAGIEIDAIDVAVADARDLLGKVQLVGSSSGTFSVDTKNPTVAHYEVLPFMFIPNIIDYAWAVTGGNHLGGILTFSEEMAETYPDSENLSYQPEGLDLYAEPCGEWDNQMAYHFDFSSLNAWWSREVEGNFMFHVSGFQDVAGNPMVPWTDPANVITLLDTCLPTVTLTKADLQNDPVGSLPLRFKATFSEPIVGLEASDFVIGGTAGASTATVVEIAPNDGSTYEVHISGIAQDGTVVVTLTGSTAVSDVAGNHLDPEGISYLENEIAFDATAPSVTINQAASQSDPTLDVPVEFTAVFSESVTGFNATDVVLSGTANPATAQVTEVSPNNGTTYRIRVTGMSGPGTVIASIPERKAEDAAGNNNTASTSTDSQVTIQTPAVPTGMTATNGTYSNRVVLSWSGVTGATHYQLSRARGIAAGSYEVFETNAPGTSFDDTSVTGCILHWYKVTACNAVGCSALSETEPNGDGYRIGGTAPGAIPNFDAGAGEACSGVNWGVPLTWDAEPSTEYYEIWRAFPDWTTCKDRWDNADCDMPPDSEFSFLVNVTETEFRDETAAGWYCENAYKIRGCNRCGCGPWSPPEMGFSGGPCF